LLKGLFSFYFKRILSTDKAFFDKLRYITGLWPINEELYKLAFIHKSASLRMPSGMLVNNERLEFLGDAILDAVVAEYLYNKFPYEKEGFLTQTRSKIVNGDYLGQLAMQIGLNNFVVSHAQNYNNNKHILGDAFEAFIGAIYLDHGYSAVRKFLLKKLLKEYINLEEILITETNYKSQLIELAQKDKKEVTFSTKLKEDCTSHLKFISFAVIDNEVIASGLGASKKEAEQDAAKHSLNKLNKQ